jgi:hypothetical protein
MKQRYFSGCGALFLTVGAGFGVSLSAQPLSPCTPQENGGQPGQNCVVKGDRAAFGNGSFETYAQTNPDGTPAAIGVEFPATLLANLPTDPADDFTHCFDANNDGRITLEPGEPECTGGHQRALALPRLSGTGFQWLLINWNFHGHPPADKYGAPHFDFHFYLQSYEQRNMIRLGRCPGLINCDDFDKAAKDLPPQFVPDGYVNLKDIAAKMGNHLLNRRAPEFSGAPFTHTMVIGTYDAHLTFFEPMITREYFRTTPNQCTEIAQPQAYETPGHYPGRYCIRYDTTRQMYRVSLEGFVKR